jgi:FkbM family methyltransferase
VITVFDVGARYGVHPRFISLFNSSSLNYFAFEVDSQEVSRLKSKYKSQRNYSIHNIGFGDKEEELEFNVLQHKGQSSFLKPNLDSLWFGKIRTQDSFIGDSKRYNLTTMDSFCAKNSLVPDFLKIDTEGYDLKVLIGGGELLKA